MFLNNLGKCGPIFKSFQQLIYRKILYVYTTKISISPAICSYTTLWKSNVTDLDSILNKL